MAGDPSLALTFVLAIDGIAILSALATGHNAWAHRAVWGVFKQADALGLSASGRYRP